MPDVERQVASDTTALPAESQIREWVTAALRDPSADCSVVVRIVDADESRELNKAYRNINKPTNVLSFPFEAPAGIEDSHLGDLVVCAPVVVSEASAQHKAPEAHWAHMIVHGVLHLQGFDHQNESQAEEMESLERQILAKLGYPDPYSIT